MDTDSRIDRDSYLAGHLAATEPALRRTADDLVSYGGSFPEDDLRRRTLRAAGRQAASAARLLRDLDVATDPDGAAVLRDAARGRLDRAFRITPR